MKVFIWSSEYLVHIAIAETEQEARSMLLNNTKEVDNGEESEFEDYEHHELQMALKDKPVILESGSIHLNHTNP